MSSRTSKSASRSKKRKVKVPAKFKAPKGKYVYTFAQKKAEGNEKSKELLGGKGANLHGMTKLGLPVPPGFTISTEVCSYFYDHKKTYPRGLDKQVRTAMARVEKVMGRKFGSESAPLLFSVRSGAPASMPGMMDTILNLGLNDETVEGLAQQSGDDRFAYDSYRRLIQMYADVVLGVHGSHFEHTLEELKAQRGVESDTGLSGEDLKGLVAEYKRILRSEGHEFPQDPWDQLWGAVGAVFGSWNNPRAKTYRKLNDIPAHWGTAVNVQAMVFGNLGDDSATGVAFTRDPSTGVKRFFGEYLVNAQGEDVVAGVRTPLPINDESRTSHQGDAITLKKCMPKAYAELVRLYRKLEKHFKDMQDIEFTIEKNRLFILQTRNGKRTAAAAVRIAVDMAKEKLISKKEAILRVNADQVDQLLHPRLDPKATKEVLCKGLPASPGAACGQVVFDSETAHHWAQDLGRKVMLVRVETSPEDIQGMAASQGILTERGGMTSHAAVVARGMGKPCVAGCSAIKVDYQRKEFYIGDQVFAEGDNITIEGSTGEVIRGEVPTITATLNKDFQQLMKWVDGVRKLGVRTNADTPHDAKVARDFGAEGIGLCRTEHMFFEADRIQAVREMILADTPAARQTALAKIMPMQRKDFYGIFEAMAGLPVTIRLLDPPLHEFIPKNSEEFEELANKAGVSRDRLERRAKGLEEFNPMLGHRGVRLGISYPEIYRTQVRAIMEAACDIYLEKKIKAKPEIMVPLVGDVAELKFVRDYCEAEIEAVLGEYKEKTKKKLPIKPMIGTMIELPRAALTADEIAEEAEFFSFGTNDLTQTTYGLSRDDAGMFLKDYLDAKVYDRDPFASLDRKGVSRLMEVAIREGRSTRKGIKLGICGEHGGDPQSIRTCQELGLDYVSCSPFRVPIARLSAAQSLLS